MSNRTIGIIAVLCWHFVFGGIIFWFATMATRVVSNTERDRIVICFCKDQEPKKEEPKK